MWGEFAKSLTPNKEGASCVVEVGGPETLRQVSLCHRYIQTFSKDQGNNLISWQALTALKLDGLIAMVGSVSSFVEPGSETKEPTFLEAIINSFTVRGVAVGSRLQFEDMNRAIEANNIHPVLDKRIFRLEEAPEAYQYLWDQKHFGKVIIEIV